MPPVRYTRHDMAEQFHTWWWANKNLDIKLSADNTFIKSTSGVYNHPLPLDAPDIDIGSFYAVFCSI